MSSSFCLFHSLPPNRFGELRLESPIHPCAESHILFAGPSLQSGYLDASLFSKHHCWQDFFIPFVHPSNKLWSKVEKYSGSGPFPCCDSDVPTTLAWARAGTCLGSPLLQSLSLAISIMSSSMGKQHPGMAVTSSFFTTSQAARVRSAPGWQQQAAFPPLPPPANRVSHPHPHSDQQWGRNDCLHAHTRSSVRKLPKSTRAVTVFMTIYQNVNKRFLPPHSPYVLSTGNVSCSTQFCFSNGA